MGGLNAHFERGKAFAGAGASGFFVPCLADPQQAERIVKEVLLPLNLIAFPAHRQWPIGRMLASRESAMDPTLIGR
jgi:2-methylisocitrate lyase-like PEP mutase family enzyme